jgi:glycine cleavage system regulatory protein
MIRHALLLTIVGPDRAGLVESLAQHLSAVDANWEESSLARLAGQFAGIVLVTVDSNRSDELVASLRQLKGLQVAAHVIVPQRSGPPGTHLRLELTGADRPGIVREVSRVLAERGVNIDELQSSVASAPMSGEALFQAKMRLLAPPTCALADLRRALEGLAGELMIDLAQE